MNLLKFSIVVLVFCFVIACASQNSANPVYSSDAVPTPAVETAAAAAGADDQGRKLYTDSCAFCHLDTGKGGKKTVRGREIDAEDLTSAKVKGFSDEKFARSINEGVPDEGMPAFKDRLNAEQVSKIIKYIRTDLQK